MLNPAGFRLAVLRVSRRGELSVDNAFTSSTPEDVVGLGKMVEMGFRDKFLTLRGFSARDSGSVLTRNGSDRALFCPCRLLWASSGDFIIDLKDSPGSADEGVSGEELGEGSATSGESNVELVVVGDESVDSEVTEEPLLLRKWS